LPHHKPESPAALHARDADRRYRFCWRRCDHRADAADLAPETFLPAALPQGVPPSCRIELASLAPLMGYLFDGPVGTCLEGGGRR
jgi:hypothetical protein